MGINEQTLLSRLAAFEDTVLKGGDPLKDAPHDGGLATEGKNIQSRDEAKKALHDMLVEKGYSKSQADKLLKMLSASDMGSDEAEGGDEDDTPVTSGGDDEEEGDDAPAPPPMAKGKAKKSLDGGVAALASAMGEDDDGLGKSFSDESRGAINAVPFLRDLVGGLSKSLGGNAVVIDRLIKALDTQEQARQSFNSKLAKALVQIEASIDAKLNELRTMVEKVGNTPVPNVRGVRKGSVDIVEPDHHDGSIAAFDGTQQQSVLMNVPILKIQERLYEMVTKGEIQDSLVVTKFENARCDLRVLGPKIIKSLEDHFSKAAA